MTIRLEAYRSRMLPLLVAAAPMLLNACQRDQALQTPITVAAASSRPAASAADAASAPRQSSQLRYSLGIVGYNYTDTAIIDYSVNGTGAFNLSVSSENAGGGSTICCFGWAPGAKLPLSVQIEWTRDEQSWCRQTVMLTDPGPLEPTTFEVHFYPDRHIEVTITDSYSPPRLKLPAAGRDYRVGEDVRKEKADEMRKDAAVAECREGRFPIGVRAEQQDRARKAKP